MAEQFINQVVSEKIEDDLADLRLRLRTCLLTLRPLLPLLQIAVDSLDACVQQAGNLQSRFGTLVSESSPFAPTETIAGTLGAGDTLTTQNVKQAKNLLDAEAFQVPPPASTSTPSTPKPAEPARTSAKSIRRSPSVAATDRWILHKLRS